MDGLPLRIVQKWKRSSRNVVLLCALLIQIIAILGRMPKKSNMYAGCARTAASSLSVMKIICHLSIIRLITVAS